MRQIVVCSLEAQRKRSALRVLEAEAHSEPSESDFHSSWKYETKKANLKKSMVLLKI